MLVTELGIVAEAREQQPANVQSPMLVIVVELGMVIEARERQFLNA
jgi:hypothetical protein